jgi:hypothetical protein
MRSSPRHCSGISAWSCRPTLGWRRCPRDICGRHSGATLDRAIQNTVGIWRGLSGPCLADIAACHSPTWFQFSWRYLDALAADLDARMDGFVSISDAALRCNFVGGDASLSVFNSAAADGDLGIVGNAQPCPSSQQSTEAVETISTNPTRIPTGGRDRGARPWQRGDSSNPGALPPPVRYGSRVFAPVRPSPFYRTAGFNAGQGRAQHPCPSARRSATPW